MRRRSEIGSVASGILHSFVSRNNDLEGYWGIGVLYLHARKVSELTVMLDLLRGTINKLELKDKFDIDERGKYK